MLQIEKLIRLLPEDVFEKLKSSLQGTRAVKFHDLLMLYKENGDEENFRKEKGLTKNAFNVLKSRLYEKVQFHLLNTEVNIENNFLLQVFNIPHLLYSEEREIALAVLEGIEKEFRQHNLFQLLMIVYQAQKKLTHGSPKYYHYSRLYNRNVAKCLSQDKAEDELAAFSFTLSKYFHSKDPTLSSLLDIQRREMQHLLKLNESPRTKIYLHFMDVSRMLLGPPATELTESSPEELLSNAAEIINTLEDGNKDHYRKVLNYLYALYYNKLGLRRDAAKALKNSFSIPEYRNYSPLISVAAFPDLHLQLYLHFPALETELIDPEPLTGPNLSDENEIMNYISAVKHDSIIRYVSGDKDLALRNIRDLLNFISLKQYPFSEIEVKVLYIIYSFSSSKELNTESILTSINRKVKELGNGHGAVENLNKLVKLLKYRIREDASGIPEKKKQLYKDFLSSNKDGNAVLPGILEHYAFSAVLA